MNYAARIIVPIVIAGAGHLGFKQLSALKKDPPKVEVHRLTQSVEVIAVKAQDVALQLPSQGMVEAERTTKLAAEVGGRVLTVSDKFKVGERVAKDEVILTLDDTDYRAALTQAEATLADAVAAESSEKAKADQALRDWTKIAGSEKPSDLALRKPQLTSAAARVKAAAAAADKAKRDVERTVIKAPFAASIRAKNTEVGSVLAPGSAVAELYATEGYEVRLPLSLDDFPLLSTAAEGALVKLTAAFAGETYSWPAKVKRVEGEVDRASRSVYVTAVLDSAAEQHPLVKPGLFVKAELEGQTLKNVIRVPRKAFLDSSRLLVVTPDNKLSFRSVKVARGTASEQLVSSGLAEGDRVVVSALGAPVEGMEVEVLSADAAHNNPSPTP